MAHCRRPGLPETWTISAPGGGEERYFLVLCPHRAHERPSWLANYTGSEELVAWKPTEYEVAALGELARDREEAA